LLVQCPIYYDENVIEQCSGYVAFESKKQIVTDLKAHLRKNHDEKQYSEWQLRMSREVDITNSMKRMVKYGLTGTLKESLPLRMKRLVVVSK
ncbi:hypothetical protein LCGC14_2814270, partial [marine sediment metagenome]